MKMVVLSGSMRPHSRSRAAAKVAAQAARELGAEVALLDLRELGIPLYDDGDETAEVKAFAKAMSEAEAMVIITPEYHGGMSGALKNALDWLGSSQFREKPVVIMAAAGGGKGGINALNNLRTVLRALLALVLPGQVVVDGGFVSEAEEVTNEALVGRIRELVAQTYQIGSALAAAREQAAAKASAAL